MSGAPPSHLDDLYRQGRAAFVAAVARKWPELRADELYLAHAATKGDSAAIAEIDRTFISRVPRFMRAAGLDRISSDDVQQQLRERLFVRGKISLYSGRGSLEGWLRLSALRLARELSEAVRDHSQLQDHDRAGLETEPELKVLRSRHGKIFKAALEEALSSLDDTQRNMLKLYFLDGLSSDAVAGLFKIDGSTVRRRLAACRKRLIDAVRARLKDELKLDSAELHSLMRALDDSGFGASISRVLRR
jgi:RNA polymerase sigma-70 factor